MFFECCNKFSIPLTFILDNNGKLQSLFDEVKTNASRQDLPTAYIPNGAIYIFNKINFIENETIPSNGSLPYIMSKEDSIDIDAEDDLMMVENILSKN